MNAAEVSTVAVIGAGTMGAGMAGMLARAGCQVHLVDTHTEVLDRALVRLGEGEQALIDAGLVSAEVAAEARDCLHAGTELEPACAGADVLIEAAPEDMALKQELFGRFDALCPAETSSRWAT